MSTAVYRRLAERLISFSRGISPPSAGNGASAIRYEYGWICNDERGLYIPRFAVDKVTAPWRG